MKHILKEGKLSKLLPEGGGGLSGEVYLIRYKNKKYVVRRTKSISKAKHYEFLSSKFKKYNFLPKFLGRFGKDVIFEYIEGRDLTKNESKKVLEEVGRIAARINKVKVEGIIDSRFKTQLKELISGKFKLSRKELEKRAKTRIKKIPRAILTKEEGKRIKNVYTLLKKKVKPRLTLDANDIVPNNFRLGEDGRVYFIDIEAIKPRIKGFGIAKFYLQWGKKQEQRKAFNRGYSLVSSLKFLTQDYFDFLYLNFLTQKVNYKVKIFNKKDYLESLRLIRKILSKYLD